MVGGFQAGEVGEEAGVVRVVAVAECEGGKAWE